MRRTAMRDAAIGAAMGFFALAGLGVLEGFVLLAAYPYWYPDPLRWTTGVLGQALLYGVPGALLFAALFAALSGVLRRGREGDEAEGAVGAFATGAWLFALLFPLAAYWGGRLFLPPFRHPLTLAFLAGIAIVAGALACYVGHRVRRRARRSPGLPVRVAASAAVLLALLDLAVGAGLERRLPESPHGRPSVLLITIDTLRDDHLPPYGYGRDTAPVFTRIAREGALFLNTVATAPFTQPATASLMTGLYPHTHGVRNHPNLLAEPFVTLAEALAAEGYRTAAFSSQGLLVPTWGFGQGFGLFAHVGSPFRFDITLLGKILHRTGIRRYERRWEADAVSRRAVEWLAGAPREPYFLWLHYLDPHFPYTPPEEYARRFDTEGGSVGLTDERDAEGRRRIFFLGLPERQVRENLDLYDAEIRCTDDRIGRVIDRLEAAGALDRTIVVITSDHGESLGEHGLYFAHTHFLYEPTMTVPLAVRYPARLPAGTRLAKQITTVDLMPTILDLAGAAIPPGLEGRSALPLLDGGDEAPVYAFGENGRTIAGDHEEENPRWLAPGDAGRWSMVRTDDWKLLRIPDEGGAVYELYDLRNDPAELVNLADGRPDMVDSLGAVLQGWMGAATAEATTKSEIDDETMRALRSLGYIH